MSYPDTLSRLENQVAQLQDARMQEARERDRMRSERDALLKALETAAARFNLMAGVGIVNGVDPKVGYRECMDALSRVGTSANHEGE